MRERPFLFAVILTLLLAGRFGFAPGSAGLEAQVPGQLAVQSSGQFPVQVDQQVLDAFKGLAQHAARLLPMLDQIRVNDWVTQGAPDTYAAQLDTARRQIHAIGTEMDALAQHPDHMQDCMKALFRVQAFHGTLDSLMGGLRKYQNPPLADLIQSVAAEDQSEIERLQTYILELADDKEQEFQIVDHEAQRCRALLSKQPAPKTTGHNAPKP
jgi:hypothetical protein